MSKIIIDIFGSDEPAGLIKGVVDAINIYDNLTIILPGDEIFIAAELSKYCYDKTRIAIIDAKEIILNNESPTAAIRQKKDSSLVKGMQLLASDESIDGMVCAGSTGATLCGGVFIVGRMEGVDRPALAGVLPTDNDGRMCLIDAGANVDCRPEYLLQFATLGTHVMRGLRNIESPKVALLSNGVEDKKGNELVHQAFDLLKTAKNINFVGNMEAREALSGKYDVCVCDGFTGNILLKSIEGTAMTVSKMLSKSLKENAPQGTDMTFVKKAFSQTMSNMDLNSHGGAILLGCKKLIMKIHGASNSQTIVAVVQMLCQLAESGIIEKVKAELGSNN